MKKMTMFGLVCVLALGFAVPNAHAVSLTIGGTGYLGAYAPPEPADPPSEVAYINNLITLAAGAVNTELPVVGSGDYYNRVGSTLAGPFPTAVEGGTVKQNNTDLGFTPTNITITGFRYLVAKYDGPGGSGRVWDLLGIVGPVSIPLFGDGILADKKGDIKTDLGLSHYSLYKSTNPDTGVPDGGMTLMLLGGAIVGFETLRRKIRA